VSSVDAGSDRADQAAPVVSGTDPATTRSLVATLLGTFLFRMAGRLDFVILSFYLGRHFTSAAGIAVVLEAFYVSELVLSVTTGGLTDRFGRRLFLLISPVAAALAALTFLFASHLVPDPRSSGGLAIVGLVVLILLGRLFEGAASGVGVPATLGLITDLTAGNQRLRTVVVTAFEAATVGGIVLAIPIGGQISRMLHTWGFVVVIALELVILFLFWRWARGRPGLGRSAEGSPLSSLLAGLASLRDLRVATFLPAWLCVNALIGAWLTLCLIVLSFPKPPANLRHPGQLLYGGFSPGEASAALGLVAVIFMAGMVVWTVYLPRIRRSTVMLAGLGGLVLAIAGLSSINSVGENIQTLTSGGWVSVAALLVPTLLGVALLSGFTPAALTQLSAMAETTNGHTGAVMGLYSVALAVGQLIGTGIGGVFVDLGGFYGLMIFSAIMGVLALASVLYLRSHGHDLTGATPTIR
jgi:MFS family permease